MLTVFLNVIFWVVFYSTVLGVPLDKLKLYENISNFLNKVDLETVLAT